MKKIGIIGSGQVAQVLGNGFLKHNYQVMLGTRSAEKLDKWKEGTAGKGLVGSFEETAKFADIIVLAVKGRVAAEALEMAGPQNMRQKTIIDATNPIADAPPENGVLKFFTTLEESLMERLQTQFPELHFVKAFNSVGSPRMVNPDMSSKPTMFICGNNDAAKSEVSGILDQFGWEVADMGKDTAARAIEPLCMLWCIPGMLGGQWTHAFRLLKD